MLSGSTGTIYSDGKVRWDGVADEGQTVVAINNHYLVEHMPSGGYWCNAGFVPVKAWLEVRMVKSIMPGNEKDTWRVELADGPSISWHPTHKVARGDAVNWLREKIDE